MEPRSRSSDQGRRCEKPWRTELERRERNARNAGVAIGACAWAAAAAPPVAVWEVEMGSVGGEAMYGPWSFEYGESERENLVYNESQGMGGGISVILCGE
ncbi:hypothetical protein PanWU01x14_015920 [Parasponia andersonii]|uniref:Uncharacterized protein n=1 Tax=Parasponia andersonii TaxID=3476 RepID=A0A2P5E0M4_PARAD|nr:hypothetical protein PanWU01x14_015920 [Parasponia andersonii]